MRMDITPHIESVRADLVTLAEAAAPASRAMAERIAQALEPSLRMALFQALTDAAAEITTQIPSGSIEVRLRGRDPEFVVDVPPPPVQGEPERYSAPAAVGADEAVDEDSDVVRITVRLPESVKVRAEEMATRTGRSLNAWIVTALRSATRDEGWTIDLGQLTNDVMRAAAGRRGSGHHVSGWL